MGEKRKVLYVTSKVGLYLCGFYFGLMGLVLIFFPGIIFSKIISEESLPIVSGLVRGAGAATLPYVVLYYLYIKEPRRNLWAGLTIVIANILAVMVNFYSLAQREYEIIHTLVDLPMEVISIFAVLVYFMVNHFE